MNPIILTKAMLFDEEIEKINKVQVEDKFFYEFIKDELHITGKAKIDFEIKLKDEEVISKVEYLDVDVILSITKIDCLSDIKLVLKDIDNKIEGPSLLICLKYQLFSNGEVYKSFQGTREEVVDEHLINALLKNSLTNKSLARNDKDIDQIIDLLNNNEVDVITYFDEPKEIVKEEVINPIIIKEEEPINVEKKIEIKDEKLFQKETYVVSYLYYIPKVNETYESIASRFAISLETIITLNKNKELVPGKMILIPKK